MCADRPGFPGNDTPDLERERGIAVASAAVTIYVSGGGGTIVYRVLGGVGKLMRTMRLP